MDNDKIRSEQIAFNVSDPDRFNILKKLAENSKNAQTVDKRFKPAKKDCKHCHGRGYVGFYDVLHKVKVICRCTIMKEY